MTAYVALLRAVNVGGTGTLAMADLRRLCAEAGFEDVATVGASGNAVFRSALPATKVKAALEAALKAHVGKPIGVVLRTGAEIADVLAGDPFPDADGSRAVAIFLDEAPPADAADKAIGAVDETVKLGRRELYVHYPSGMGRSKLRIPGTSAGTARNMNTVAKLVAKAKALG